MNRPRGRPRAYDRDQALDAALATFWANGFEGASLADLAEAMEMNRPSVYAAFGNKEALFAEALERFAARVRAHVQLALEQPDLATALHELFVGLVDLYRPHGQGRGCLVFGVGVACSTRDEAIRQQVAEALRDLDAALTRRFEKAVLDGQLAPDADPAPRAALAASVVHGLSVRARAGTRAKELRRFAEACIPLLVEAGGRATGAPRE